MGRLRLATEEGNYKVIDRQLKEQFIHGLNDNDMLVEIIRGLSKAEKSTAVTSEQVLVWAKRVDAQRAQSTIITCLSKTKEFDKVKAIKGGQRHNLSNQTHVKTPVKQSGSYCGSSHPPRQYLACRKKCTECGKMRHFREVCRSGRNRTIHGLKQEPYQHHEEEEHIDMVNKILLFSIANSR